MVHGVLKHLGLVALRPVAPYEGPPDLGDCDSLYLNFVKPQNYLVMLLLSCGFLFSFFHILLRIFWCLGQELGYLLSVISVGLAWRSVG